MEGGEGTLECDLKTVSTVFVEGHLDYTGLLATMCFNDTKKENKIYYVFIFVYFWWFGRI
jgi:hypothetical protein